jgi:SAM-dependent methyltransferase
VLDVRAECAFHNGHLEGSGSIPITDLRARRSELPPREKRILVVAGDAVSAAEAAADLTTMGLPHVYWLDARLSELDGGLASRGPAARLWRPAPFLEEVLPAIPRGLAADLASGAGREAVFLATKGFEVEAWDSDATALGWATALATRHGATIKTIECDLESPEPPLAPARYQLVVCFRFLYRPLFPIIARSLAPGGHLVYETYRVGQERFGRPRRRQFLLESGELVRAFAELEILRYEETNSPAGPLTARLLARWAE